MSDGDGVGSAGFEASSGSIGEDPGTTADVDTATCGVTNRTVTLRTTEASEPPPIGRRSEKSSAACTATASATKSTYRGDSSAPGTAWPPGALVDD